MRITLSDIEKKPHEFNSQEAYEKYNGYFDDEINQILDRDKKNVSETDYDTYRLVMYHQMVSAIQQKKFDKEKWMRQ